ncbi:MAG: CDP-diacylglycerol--serine O-phosphatidyltransferase [Bacteroidetes bacterium]|nr:CDP-diacylglycerol--serine O-phosphatidyltransferase [Bacteroidota bacterium]
MDRKKSIVKHIPNFITSLNMICGILSIVLMIEGMIIPALYLILLAAVFDFLDGFSARIFNAYSDIGKQLDSLADIISFGLVPALLMFNYIKYSFLMHQPGFAIETATWHEIVFLFSPLLIAVTSGFRLARFNIDPGQTYTFSGLPTPANAILIASVGLVIFSPDHPENLRQFILNPYLLLVSTLVLSYLLVSRIPMFSLKFRDYRFRNNITRYVFLFISLVLLIILKVIAIPAIIIAYILISVTGWIAGQGVEWLSKLRS